MISKNARYIILELVDLDLDRLHINFDRHNDNDLTQFVSEHWNSLQDFEFQYGVEFYD